MKPWQSLEKHRTEVRAVLTAHHVSDVRVFGSVASESDTEQSDLDLLVEPTQETTLFDLGAIRHELRKLLGCSVDVYTLESLPGKQRETILADAISL